MKTFVKGLAPRALEMTTGSQSDGVIQFKEAPNTLQRPHLEQKSKKSSSTSTEKIETDSKLTSCMLLQNRP